MEEQGERYRVLFIIIIIIIILIRTEEERGERYRVVCWDNLLSELKIKVRSVVPLRCTNFNPCVF